MGKRKVRGTTRHLKFCILRNITVFKSIFRTYDNLAKKAFSVCNPTCNWGTQSDWYVTLGRFQDAPAITIWESFSEVLLGMLGAIRHAV